MSPEQGSGTWLPIWLRVVRNALTEFAGVSRVADVLLQVVGRIAEANKHALLLVLDGMSWAVCDELLSDMRQDHGLEAMLDSSSLTPAPVIVTVPSESSYSRESLLYGLLTIGDATDEKRNFEENPALQQCCDRKYPPLLLHKMEVTKGARGVVGEDLTRAMLSPNSRLVGVVINAIGDRLDSAADSGRLVDQPSQPIGATLEAGPRLQASA